MCKAALNTNTPFPVVGAGLAGSEVAWQIAEAGYHVVLYEMRPKLNTPAHTTDLFGELVCSNSLRSDDPEANAVGILHRELRALNSLIMRCADATRVPAGSALAVDRLAFSTMITQAIRNHPRIHLCQEELCDLAQVPNGAVIATGPLTSARLAQSIQTCLGSEPLAFFDALSPIVYAETIDTTVAWKQSRYNRSTFNTDEANGQSSSEGDYINCPLTKETYVAFVEALRSAEYTAFKEWELNETPYFNGCLPIEVMAQRGTDTLRFGPMKPTGLFDPHKNRRPYAVVQLRQDNALGTLYNLVGFQTKMTHSEQKRIFRTIPGLESAEFARLGGVHRNTYLNTPKLLNPTLELPAFPMLRFAGQITGCEGYVESCAIGLCAALFTLAAKRHLPCVLPPRETAIGALLHYITQEHRDSSEHTHDKPLSFQPMNINFGLFPPMQEPNQSRLSGREKKRQLSLNAKQAMDQWLQEFVQPLSSTALCSV